MLRSQILLTQELDKEIRKISGKQNISQSEAVRKLLAQALGMKNSSTNLPTQTPNPETLLHDLGTFKMPNQRIDGFKEIYSVGGKTAEIKILGDEIFRYYLANKAFPVGFEYVLLKYCNELKELSETHKLVVRRAYVVPGLPNPPGPRFIGLQPSEVLQAITDIYDFAIDNEYHVKDMSQIAVFIHPFADPKQLTFPIKPGATLPYGGYAAPLNKESNRVEVFAVWGNNEGVQSFDAIDRYIVDTDRAIVTTKDIPQKNLMLCTTQRAQSDKISVPLDRQFEQVLSDLEILEIARVVKELSARYGLRRVEFSYDGTHGIEFNESAEYEIYERKLINLDKRGFVKVVASEKEIAALKQLTDEQVGKTIVYISKSIIEDRAYDLLNSIAGMQKKFTVLYPGLSATAHAMRILNDFGHTAIVVGNRVFTDGQELLVKVVDDQITIEPLSEDSIRSFLVNLYDARLFGLDVVGGKATNLSLLKTKGFNVPHGWVITTSFYDKVAQETEEVSAKLWRQISKNLPLDTKKKYAIRSSATVEDQIEHSFAGQFDTYLNVTSKDVGTKVLQVIKSTLSKHVATYVNALGQNKPIKMAVVIQEMVEVDKAGVVFGKDIQTGNDDYMVIDVAKGLGEGVVDGVAKTQRVLFSRNKNRVINQNLGEAKLILDKVELNSLIEMAFSIERLMGKIQDIEWAIDVTGEVWLVQSRDL